MKNEFNEIVREVLEIEEFKKLKNIKHHGITRYDHSLRVAYYTYMITRIMGLNYEEATIAALLHDFFIDEVNGCNIIRRLQKHPKYAVINASKYFDLTDLQEDIIYTHMFPVTIRPPKYLESWIVDLVDDISALYETFYCFRKEINAATTFIFIILINMINK